MPGTHDIELLKKSIDKLLENRDGDVALLPKFSEKPRNGHAYGDRVEESQYYKVKDRVDLVIV